MALMPTAASRGWLQSLVRELRLDRHAEHLLTAVEPTWSRDRPVARVVDILSETDDVKTFVLRPGQRWPGHVAGQYATIEVDVDGVRQQRCYSISSAPTEPLPAITVKRVPGGRVSGWLHDRLRVGDVVGLAAPAGDFTLPAPRPERLLLYSGGSGITPVMSILRELDRSGSVSDVVFVHHARSRRDVIFARELEELNHRHQGLRVILRLDDELGGAPPFHPKWLAGAVVDHAERATYLCGPSGLMAAVEEHWVESGAAGNLATERFAGPTIASPTDIGQARVVLHGADRAVVVDRSAPLLDGLEAAGEQPAHGCRMGICHSCACNKRSGTVRNLQTGEVSSAPDEQIRLCVSAALTDLDLDL